MIKFLDLQKITAKYADEIHEAVNRVVDSGWYLQGKEVEKFEKDYADFIGTNECITCANGLDALIWILRAYIELGIMKPGDEVIVPANTYIASILAITENGLVPVLVEPDITTYQIDPDKIEAAITPRTKGVLIDNVPIPTRLESCVGNMGLSLLKIMLRLMVASSMAVAQVRSAMQPDTASIRERILEHLVMPVQ